MKTTSNNENLITLLRACDTILGQEELTVQERGAVLRIKRKYQFSLDVFGDES